MRVRIDENLCQGSSSCVVAAPEVFDFDNDQQQGFVPDPEVPEQQQARVRMAKMQCPTGAVIVEED